MTDTIEIKIQAPPPPYGFMIWDGEGNPNGEFYYLSSDRLTWYFGKHLLLHKPLAYAIPIPIPKAKPKTLRQHLIDCTDWMESNRACGDWGDWDWEPEDAYSQAIKALASGEPTVEERLIEAVGVWTAYRRNLAKTLDLDPIAKDLIDAYRAYQEMRGEG